LVGSIVLFVRDFASYHFFATAFGVLVAMPTNADKRPMRS